MEKENMIELLEDFIDFLKDKEDEKKKEKEVEVIVTEDKAEDKDDEDFDNAISKIAKGE